MRLTLIAGLLLILVGAVVLLRGGTLTTRRDVIDFAGVRVSADERHTIEPWGAGLALVIGTILVVAGSRRRAS